MSDSREQLVSQQNGSDLSGRQLGDYRILRRLGHGAMAEVYLAEQCSLRRHVAFKVLKASLSSDENAVRRFHQEARAVASLVHANIVQTHEVGCIDGVHFIAQEYVKGQNLRQLIARRGSLALPLAMAVLRQAAAALHKAGGQGIVHRDVKPENILISANGDVKVADFGLARVVGPDDGLSLTQDGITMGTPLYMSPEQVEGRRLDQRSDIYSLGVTCYHMLAGRTPFEGETALNVAVQHLNTKPQPLSELRPDLPVGVCGIVQRMLAKDPSERYEHAGDLLKDLRQLAVEAPDEEWAAELADLTVADMAAVTEARCEATQALDAHMKTIAMSAITRGRAWRLALAVVLAGLAAFAMGAVIAWATRTDFLLAPSGEATEAKVEPRETVESQYFYAVLQNTEAAWQAVWEHFPAEDNKTNRYYMWRAKQQLARLYLAENDLGKATEILDELADVESTEDQFRAFVLAGQVIVFSLQGKDEEAKDKLASVLPLRDQLDPQMREEIDRLARRYGARSGGGPNNRGRPENQRPRDP